MKKKTLLSHGWRAYAKHVNFATENTAFTYFDLKLEKPKIKRVALSA
jgi:hypothetical protein